MIQIEQMNTDFYLWMWWKGKSTTKAQRHEGILAMDWTDDTDLHGSGCGGRGKAPRRHKDTKEF
ncbi:hypothetical protein K5X82_15775 [Halosquirtibacter xylanolyticus]|uniref:hypothetical protein n=1 Tax=Halosquirtibacter xylanolyticus TaxID=3374599 RepID=UPI0037478705|nr:hypothetical protein K5X82_15775 [Prolixibacteraceae bacterium]